MGLFGMFQEDGTIGFKQFLNLASYFGLHLGVRQGLDIFAVADLEGHAEIGPHEFVECLHVLRPLVFKLTSKQAVQRRSVFPAENGVSAIHVDVNESPAVGDDEIKMTVPKPRSCATDRANGNCPLKQNFACVFQSNQFPILQRAKQAKRFNVIASQSALHDNEYYRDVKFAGVKYCMVKQGVNICDHLGHPTRPIPPPTAPPPTLPPTSHADFLKAIDAKAVAQAIREARARHNADHDDHHEQSSAAAAHESLVIKGCRGRVRGKWVYVAC
jgi:hypothetical protein